MFTPNAYIPAQILRPSFTGRYKALVVEGSGDGYLRTAPPNDRSTRSQGQRSLIVWTLVTNATSPLSVAPSARQMFYRAVFRPPNRLGD